MKSLRIGRIGILGVALAIGGSEVGAQESPDRYAPLRAALSIKKKEAVEVVEESRSLAGEYERFLENPDISSAEKPALRIALIQEQARTKKLQAEVSRLQAAIYRLKCVPRHEDLTAAALKESHEGLGELGSKGRAAWDQLIEKRNEAIDSLKEKYREELTAATLASEELNIVERANQILLQALDVHRQEASDTEFDVSRGLSAIKTEVELGFGIVDRSEDQNLEAQATLIALVGYSQFFWDHHAGIREHLGEDELPSDQARNILGVPDGDVLASNAVARNESNLFYLSDEAKGKFNERIRAIWGADGSISVSWWDHRRAKSFHRACAALATVEKDVLLPNTQLFRLLDEIDAMIKEKEYAELAIQDIQTGYEQKLEEARSFGEMAALSSAHFNALQLAENSERTVAQFEAACRLLDNELAACAEADWKPNTRGIVASAQTLSMAYERLVFAGQVKQELSALLH